MKITLSKFLDIYEIQNNQSLSEIDKALYSVCSLYGLTENQLNEEDPRKVLKMIDKVSKVISSKPKEKKFLFPYKVNYNIDQILFGQYIELCFYIQTDAIKYSHAICASVSKHFLLKKDHNKRAEYFIKKDVHFVLGIVKKVVENFSEFNMKNKKLFESNIPDDNKVEHFFTKRFGWIYSATQVADHYKITLDQAFKLPLAEAFSALAYLKAKSEYSHLQLH